jgi:hypothetical protein
MFGKRAKVAFKCLAAMTGFSIRHVKRLVKSLTIERRLLRVTKRVLCRGITPLTSTMWSFPGAGR